MSIFDNRWFHIGWVTHGGVLDEFRSIQVQLTLWSRRTWPR